MECDEFTLDKYADWLNHLENCQECMASFYKNWYHQHGEFLLENSIDLGGQHVRRTDNDYHSVTALQCSNCGRIWKDFEDAQGHYCYEVRRDGV